jgi:hydrogenase expression/formation protein HypC
LEELMCLAVPGKIVSITGADVLRSANVSFGGTCRTVSLAFVPEAKAGDYVMVHVGFALSVVDEVEAKRTLEYLRQMGELAEMSNPA